jgi:hypothetical protein
MQEERPKCPITEPSMFKLKEVVWDGFQLTLILCNATSIQEGTVEEVTMNHNKMLLKVA